MIKLLRLSIIFCFEFEYSAICGSISGNLPHWRSYFTYNWTIQKLSQCCCYKQKKIKQFSYKYIPKSDVKKDILNLDVSKASQDSDIPTKIIKINADIFAEVLCNVFSRSLEVGEFPSGMKLVNVTPVHKKGNYRPVSILPDLSKVFERCLHKQISYFFDTILSLFNSATRKMARKYRSRTRIWYSSNWPFQSFWLSSARFVYC